MSERDGGPSCPSDLRGYFAATEELRLFIEQRWAFVDVIVLDESTPIADAMVAGRARRAKETP